MYQSTENIAKCSLGRYSQIVTVFTTEIGNVGSFVTALQERAPIGTLTRLVLNQLMILIRPYNVPI